MRFNGKPDLTTIQVQERARRNRRRLSMYGLLTPRGTAPREPDLSGKPIFKVMKSLPVPAENLTALLTAVIPFLSRRMRRHRK